MLSDSIPDSQTPQLTGKCRIRCQWTGSWHLFQITLHKLERTAMNKSLLSDPHDDRSFASHLQPEDTAQSVKALVIFNPNSCSGCSMTVAETPVAAAGCEHLFESYCCDSVWNQSVWSSSSGQAKTDHVGYFFTNKMRWEDIEWWFLHWFNYHILPFFFYWFIDWKCILPLLL